MGKSKITPLIYLNDLLNRGIKLGLMEKDECEYIKLQSQENKDKMQENITIWREKIFLFEKPDKVVKREWVLAKIVMYNKKSYFLRIDGERFWEREEAVHVSKEMNESLKENVILVVDINKSTCPSILNEKLKVLPKTYSDFIKLILQSEVIKNEEGKDEELNWKKNIIFSNGYLPLQRKGIVAIDVHGLIDLCVQADGSVTQLGLSKNYLSSEGVVLLSKLLEEHATAVSDSMKSIVEESLSIFPAQLLTGLFLSCNNINDDGVFALCHLIQKNCLPLLIKLGLNANNITDEGAIMLAETIDENKNKCSLKVIGLSKNLIESRGAMCLARSLAHNDKITRLFLNYNPLIQTEAAIYFANTIKCHLSLKRLGLAECSINDDGGKALMDATSLNSNIERVCVWNNNFSIDLKNIMEKLDVFNFDPKR